MELSVVLLLLVIVLILIMASTGDGHQQREQLDHRWEEGVHRGHVESEAVRKDIQRMTRR